MQEGVMAGGRIAEACLSELIKHTRLPVSLLGSYEGITRLTNVRRATGVTGVKGFKDQESCPGTELPDGLQQLCIYGAEFNGADHHFPFQFVLPTPPQEVSSFLLGFLLLSFWLLCIYGRRGARNQ